MDIALKSGASSLVEMEATLNLGKALEGEGGLLYKIKNLILYRKTLSCSGIV
jgi:hypothetical protein